VKNQVYQWNMEKNYRNNIFESKGHNPWHTRYFTLYLSCFSIWKFEGHWEGRQWNGGGEDLALFEKGCLDYFELTITKNNLDKENRCKKSNTLGNTQMFLNYELTNFTNNLQAAFAPIFFCQNITMPNCKLRWALHNTFAWKSCS